jgi:hypothetical protein
MLTYPFREADVEVQIPKKFRAWFSAKPSLTLHLKGDQVDLPGVLNCRLVPVASGGFAVVRGSGVAGVVVGEFDKYTVRRTLNDRILRQVGAIRSAVYGVSYPAPLAYVLQDYSLVHPGECFEAHSERVTLKALYSVKDEDARCCVCKEAFV